jgi:hypothetical protein
MSVTSAGMARQIEILNGLQEWQNHNFITKFMTKISGVNIKNYQILPFKRRPKFFMSLVGITQNVGNSDNLLKITG